MWRRCIRKKDNMDNNDVIKETMSPDPNIWSPDGPFEPTWLCPLCLWHLGRVIHARGVCFSISSNEIIELNWMPIAVFCQFPNSSCTSWRYESWCYESISSSIPFIFPHQRLWCIVIIIIIIIITRPWPSWIVGWWPVRENKLLTFH